MADVLYIAAQFPMLENGYHPFERKRLAEAFEVVLLGPVGNNLEENPRYHDLENHVVYLIRKEFADPSEFLRRWYGATDRMLAFVDGFNRGRTAK